MDEKAENKRGSRLPRTRVLDVVLVALVILGSALSIVMIARAHSGDVGKAAVVEVNGREIRRVQLGENKPGQEIVVRGFQGLSTLEVQDSRVRMLESACRDKICIAKGWVRTPGDSIVCLPNRVVIRVTGSKGRGSVDTVTE